MQLSSEQRDLVDAVTKYCRREFGTREQRLRHTDVGAETLVNRTRTFVAAARHENHGWGDPQRGATGWCGATGDSRRWRRSKSVQTRR